MQSGSQKWLEAANKKSGRELLVVIVLFIAFACLFYFTSIGFPQQLNSSLQSHLFWLTLYLFYSMTLIGLGAYAVRLAYTFFRYRLWFLDCSKYAYYVYSIYHFLSFPQLRVILLLGLSIASTHFITLHSENSIADFVSHTFLFLIVYYALYTLLKSSRQLVIGKFKLYDEKSNVNISNLLHSRLESLATLFSVVDTALPQKTTDTQQKSSKARVSAFGTSALFEEITQSEISIKTKVLEIPITAVLKMMRIIFRKPEITGELQKLDDLYILTAQSTGKHKFSWRVLSTDFNVSWIDGKRYASVERVLNKEQDGIKLSGSEELLIYSMVEQLATRIYTDMGSVGSKRWQAVGHFINGIRYYRHTLTENTNHDIYLRRAEKEFFDAWQDDMTFDQCYYNLAVIHRALHQEDAACKLLSTPKAQKHIPSLYTYAEMNFEHYKRDRSYTKFCEAEKSCQQIIEYAPQHAAAMYLLALLNREIDHGGCAEDCRYKKTCDQTDSTETETYHKTASAIAWKELCLNLKPRMRDKLVQQAFELSDFDGKIQNNRKHILIKHHLNSVGIFLQSTEQYAFEQDHASAPPVIPPTYQNVLDAPINGEARFHLGQYYEKQGRYERADHEYNIAYVMDKEIPQKYNLGATYFNRIMYQLEHSTDETQQKDIAKEVDRYIRFLEHDRKVAEATSLKARDQAFNECIAFYYFWIGRFNRVLAECAEKQEQQSEKMDQETADQNERMHLLESAIQALQENEHNQRQQNNHTAAFYKIEAHRCFHKAACMSENKLIHYFHGTILFQRLADFMTRAEVKKIKDDWKEEHYSALSLLETGNRLEVTLFNGKSKNILLKYCYALQLLAEVSPRINQLLDKEKILEKQSEKDKEAEDELKQVRAEYQSLKPKLNIPATHLKDIADTLKTPNVYFQLYRIARMQKDDALADAQLLKAQSLDAYSFHFYDMFT